MYTVKYEKYMLIYIKAKKIKIFRIIPCHQWPKQKYLENYRNTFEG